MLGWSMWSWLLNPIQGGGEHFIPQHIAWHARIMVACWGIAAPLAIVIARYFKVMPGQNWPTVLDNKFWWHSHRLLNYSAVAGCCAAIVLVWGSASYSGLVRILHAGLGWCLLCLGLVQVLSAHLRGSKGGPSNPRRAADGSVRDLHGDHFDMTPRRKAFERVHKSLGYAALLLAVTAIVLGLWLADAPRWMWIVMALWWLALIAVASRLQRAGRCLDTYQAIWGPDPQLPGAAVRPIGWGIRRVAAGVASDSAATHTSSRLFNNPHV